MSEFTNDDLSKMHKKNIQYNKKYATWYYAMFMDDNSTFNTDTGEILLLDKNMHNNRYFNKSERINNCMNYWSWDCYHKNKILDLIKVNRCKNNRFCPNCRLLDICKFIHKFKDVLNDYVAVKGYKLYMLTLTVPNVKDYDLDFTLKKLSATFRKFNQKYSPTGNNQYHDRSVDINGGVKVLEITYNKKTKAFHPHYHCVVLIKNNIDDKLLKKNILGKFSNKRNAYDYKSYLDCEFGLIWSMLYQDIRINKKTLSEYQYIPSNMYLDSEKYYRVLEVDFREMDEKGFYEVFKYTFKDSDIPNYHVFYTLDKALDGKRIRQGFGELYKLKCEDVDVGDLQNLDLKHEESPEILLMNNITELYTKYKDYKKISRFNPQIDNNIVG